MKLSTEDMLFVAIMAMYLAGWVYSYYLHNLFWKRRHSKMKLPQKLVYILLTTAVGVCMLFMIYYTFQNNTVDQFEVIMRMTQMFIATSVFFSMLYFLLYLYNKREFGRADEDATLADTLYGKYFQMIYLSVITFFTVGNSDLMPFGIASRVANFCQIMLADIVCMFLYARSKYVFRLPG